MQRKGINYEKKVAAAVSRLLSLDDFMIHGQWIYVNDTFCQPDLVVVQGRGPRLVLEVKLTRKRGAERKLREIYGPLVQALFGGDVAYAQIYKNVDGPDPDFMDLDCLWGLRPSSYVEVLWR